jgi:uncharacterized membrane protein
MQKQAFNPSEVAPASVAPRKSHRTAAIDWMRGFVMVLMVIDHSSMAFDRNHLSQDSALYPDAATMALPSGEFFTRWMTHLCAPTFVFLAGTALALSIDRRVANGVKAWDIDKGILIRALNTCKGKRSAALRRAHSSQSRKTRGPLTTCALDLGRAST